MYAKDFLRQLRDANILKYAAIFIAVFVNTMCVMAACGNNVTETGEDCDGGIDCYGNCTCPEEWFPDSGGCLVSDNCPTVSNPTQLDTDSDGLGDACDFCPEDAGNDDDMDGVCAPDDCNDHQADVRPGMFEYCDGIDNDCSGTIDDTGDQICDDGVDCNGLEACEGTNGCQPREPVDCSMYDFTEVVECDYEFEYPANTYTFDYRKGFTSECIEDYPEGWHCTQGNGTVTYSCSVEYCVAECDINSSWEDYCSGTERRLNGSCGIGSCFWSYTADDCSLMDERSDIVPAEYREVPIEGEACNKMKQKKQECTNYTCGGNIECLLSVTTCWEDVEAVDYDEDDDNACNEVDNCLGLYNPEQDNFDNDTYGDACEDDDDNDGINDTDDPILGNETNITIEISEEVMQFSEDNETLVELNVSDLAEPVNTRELMIEDINGSIIIQGISLKEDESKTVYLKKFSEYTTVCIKDAEIANVSQISAGCNKPDERFLECNGTPQDGYACTLENETTFVITGLRYSGARQDTDNDADGYTSNQGDCNDNDPNVSPLAEEVCNDVDDNCNEEVDEGLTSEFYLDSDADGYGTPSKITWKCYLPEGYSDNNEDCNDNDPNVNPSAQEICNEIDDNCNNQVDEGLTSVFYRDYDNDGYGTSSKTVRKCFAPAGYVTNNLDCNDRNASMNPSAENIPCDGIANDCSGEDALGTDSDQDGYYLEGGLCGPLDCNDDDASINPEASEICDGMDNDCNELTDAEDSSLLLELCEKQDGVCANSVHSSEKCMGGAWQECTETDYGQDYSLQETCPDDEVDNNCDGEATFNCEALCDADHDGYKPIDAPWYCVLYLEGDCDDSNADLHPGADEFCNGIDDDCDSNTPDGSGENWYGQETTCGTGGCSSTGVYTCQEGIQADTCVGSEAEEEVCDNVDNDCDGIIDAITRDCASGHGGTCGEGTETCIGGVWQGCPGIQPELCNGIDDDCDNEVDEDSQVKLEYHQWQNWGNAEAIANYGITPFTYADSLAGSPFESGTFIPLGTEYNTTNKNVPGLSIDSGNGYFDVWLWGQNDGIQKKAVNATLYLDGIAIETVQNVQGAPYESSRDGKAKFGIPGQDQVWVLAANRINFVATVSSANDAFRINYHKITCTGNDADGDTIPDYLDLCPESISDAEINLTANHYADTDQNGVFETKVSKKAPITASDYTLQQTLGCTCKDILEAKSGQNTGQNEMGCTKGTVEEWIKLKSWVKKSS